MCNIQITHNRVATWTCKDNCGWAKKARADEKRATKILRERGIVDLTSTDKDKAEFDKMIRKVQEGLVGSVYPRTLLEDVRKLVGKK